MSELVSSVLSRTDVLTNLIDTSSELDFCIVPQDNTTNTWPVFRNRNVCRMLILDSSFNPPTKAHAELVNAATCSYPPEFFDTALLLFSTNNADKKLSGASVVQRVQMMELLSTTLDQPAVIGLTRHGKFIDKATHITRWFDTKYNKTKGLELYFIVGYDTMIRFMDPKYYAPVSVKEALSPFFEQCHLICADRPHDDDKALFWKKTLEMFGSDRVKQIELHPTTAAISSTKVRMDAEHTDMVNDAILAFIKASNLYKKEQYLISQK